MPALFSLLVLADAAPSGTVLGIMGVVLLALVVGLFTLAFFAVRGVFRLVRRRVQVDRRD